MLPNGSLLIGDVEEFDEGLFRCLAHNGIGSPVNREASLQVQGMLTPIYNPLSIVLRPPLPSIFLLLRGFRERGYVEQELSNVVF